MKKSEWMEWMKTIAAAVVLSLLITAFIRPTLVDGQSMYPTLDHHDYLMMYRQAYSGDKEPAVGDIIVFRSNLLTENGKRKNLVKRVIGVEGDHILVTGGRLFINGELQSEDYINGDYTDGEVDVVILPGYVFAMGDNRSNSTDSRDESVGPVPKGEILGKVFLRLFPFNKVQGF
ncbi:MAG: signal peptidase I [Peptostreptococcaceae bacterium]|nr:signal peptidase I [Peptostreptococcaceae bacterium]